MRQYRIFTYRSVSRNKTLQASRFVILRVARRHAKAFMVTADGSGEPLNTEFKVRSSGQIESVDLSARVRRAGSAAALRCSDDEIRAAKVARAKELVRDPNYPSPQVLNTMARMFARHWTV